MTTIQRAIEFATERHTGQTYAGKLPYTYHLGAVARVLKDFHYDDYVHQASAWLHDVVEDTPTKLEEIEAEFGMDVARYVWTVSGFGVNRAAREADLFRKLDIFKPPAILKVADRIGNQDTTICDPDLKTPNIGKVKMYLKCRESFTTYMQPWVPPIMWARLEKQYTTMAEILEREAAYEQAT